MTPRRLRWVLVFGVLGVASLVTLAFLWIRVSLGPPNPEIRQYIEENPEVLTTLPQGESEDNQVLRDSIEAAKQQLLARATLRLSLSEQGEAQVLREKMVEEGREGMSRAELRRMLELDNKCMALLTPTELEVWRLTMQRLSERAETDADR